MKIRLSVFLFLFIGLSFLNEIKAQSFANFSSDFNDFGQRVCIVDAVVDTIIPSVTIRFNDAASNTGYSTSVYRRQLNGVGADWILQISNLPAGTTGWTDANVAKGDIWEYQVRRNNSWMFGGNAYNAIGYTCATVLSDQSNYKGQMILLLAQNIAAALPVKITRLKRDLTADGWFVNEVIVPEAYDWYSGDTVIAVKNEVLSVYNSAPLNDKPKTLFILGHVPMPRSGRINSPADGHSQNAGARGADSYYADVDGIWTDTSTFNPGGLQTDLAINLPADFKFDQDFLPSDIEMSFGRVDFKDITDFTTGEIALTESYLDRLHDYKIVAPGFFMGSKTAFDYGYNNSNDQSLRTLPNISGVDSVYENGYATNFSIAYLNANGPFAVNMQNHVMPDISEWKTEGMPATIYSSDQSYWGWGDVPQAGYIYSTIRSVLGAETKCLVSLWTTSGANQFNQLAVGEDIGTSLKQIINHNTVNNKLERPQQQWDTPDWYNRTFLTMYGDPTLRLYQVYPASDLIISDSSNAAVLNWNASPDQRIVGYHIYKSNSEFGIYTRITSQPTPALTYTDPTYQNNDWYMVRAVIHQKTGNGFFINPGAGIFAKGNFNVGLNELNNTSLISIYPNPSKGKFTIITAEKIVSIEITNMLGELIFTQTINTDHAEIDLSNEFKGIYLCKIRIGNNKIEIEKITVN